RYYFPYGSPAVSPCRSLIGPHSHRWSRDPSIADRQVAALCADSCLQFAAQHLRHRLLAFQLADLPRAEVQEQVGLTLPVPRQSSWGGYFLPYPPLWVPPLHLNLL